MAYMCAADVARWFILRNNVDVLIHDGEPLTHLKLQKLLYYAQGLFLAYTDGESLFDEDILAWEHGPVVQEVYSDYRHCGKNFIEYSQEDRDMEILDNASEREVVHDVLEAVYENYNKYSAWHLRNMTHEEKPWKSTPLNAVIRKPVIFKYFKEEVLDE